jgi:hypothetical protein
MTEVRGQKTDKKIKIYLLYSVIYFLSSVLCRLFSNFCQKWPFFPRLSNEG